VDANPARARARIPVIRSAATGSSRSSARSRITCQRIEGSESSSHRTTRRSNFGSCPPGVSFTIRRFLPALVEGDGVGGPTIGRTARRGAPAPPMWSILGSEPPHQAQSEEGRSPRRPRSCHEPQVLWRGSPSNSGGLWAGQGPIPKGPPRKGTTPPAAPAASAGSWARTPRAARPLATRPRPKRPARRAAAAAGSAMRVLEEPRPRHRS
jgi:hypothetical protein